MLRNRIFLRSLAVFFMLQIVFNTIFPTISWALTAGPTAPEYTSFEPVDTTDMVNLATGDFVYNIPLLEVPGPSGGYPLSLSYHAGIMPNEEASWVGLGFSLNPGALNRTVNNFADDVQNARKEIEDYWGGGEQTTKTYTLGVSIPKMGVGVSYTLARKYDTYRGFSTSGSMGISVNPFGLAAIVGSLASGSGSGTSFDDLSDSEKVEALRKMDYENATARIESNSASAGNISSANTAFMMGKKSEAVNVGINMSSSGGTTVSVAGYTFSQKNNNAGKISSHTKEFDRGQGGLGMFTLTLKEFYTRYWSDQTDLLLVSGSLYPSITGTDDFNKDVDYSYGEFQSYASDIYDVYDPAHPDPQQWETEDEADPTRQIGGSFMAYDHYQVLGQGIGGAIQPYIFENGDIKGQNSYYRHPALGRPLTGYPIFKYNNLKEFSAQKKVDFRFKNDFSNNLSITSSTINYDGNDFSLSGHTALADSEGFNNSATSQKLAGSKHIDWFTNEEIVNGTAKAMHFIDCFSAPTDRPLNREVYYNYLQPEAYLPYESYYGGENRGKGSGMVKTDKYDDTEDWYANGAIRFQTLKPAVVDLSQRIGGFKITNESGVTYHYALPVYAYNEYTRLKRKNTIKDAATITELKNDEPYAYTWLLTAITGPDFVDRGGLNGLPNGILDDEDYGYWVKFDYGLWADSYQWRTPHSGYTTDFESEYETFSYGIKQLYYLDAIETKTHKAFFIKSKRKDGRGVTSRLEGGSNPRSYKWKYTFGGVVDRAEISFSVSPVSTMKLDSIFLFDKKELEGIPISKDRGEKYNENPAPYPYEGDNYSYTITDYQGNPRTIATLKDGEDFIYVKYHNGDNVFDKYDIEGLNDFTEKALKIISFNTDYSLASGVPNSIGYYSDFGDECAVTEGFSNCEPSEADLDFEWAFEYIGLNGYSSYTSSQCVDGYARLPFCCSDESESLFYIDPLRYYQNTGNNCPEADSPFAGDKIRYFRTGKLTLKEVQVLGHGGVKLVPPIAFSYDKNPDYTAKNIDEWGYYKSDYVDYDTGQGTPGAFSNVSIKGTQKITPVSAQNVDAWSLSSVKLPLGTEFEINYEAKDFTKSVYNDGLVLGIEKIDRESTDNVKIYLKEKGLKLTDYFVPNQQIGLKVLVVSDYGSGKPTSDTYETSTSNVVSVGSDYIIVQTPNLLQLPNLNELLRNGRTKAIDLTLYSLTPYFISGIIITDDNPYKFCGGVRVKDISLLEYGGRKSTTEYSYLKPGTNISSGVTSYVPFNMTGVNYPTDVNFFNTLVLSNNQDVQKELASIRSNFQRVLNKSYEKFMLFSREAPAPGSLYEFVTVRSKSGNEDFNQYQVYQFTPFSEDMITINRTKTSNFSTNVYYANAVIKNNSIDVGNLVRAATYSKDGQLLSEKKFGYLYDDTDLDFELPLKDLAQGKIDQSFHKYTTLRQYKPNDLDPPILEYESHKAVVTKKEERSNVLTYVEEIDYKSGLKTTTENHAFDFFTGQPLKTVSTDGYGNKYLAESKPAYSLKSNGASVYEGMGLKLFNPNNRHMLSQNAAAYVYKVEPNDPENEIALVSASAQTWSNSTSTLEQDGQGYIPGPEQYDIWRKQASYSWKGDDVVNLSADGLYPFANFQEFNFEDPEANSAQWQKNSEITLYDVQSHALEATDINQLYAATKFSLDNSYVFSTAANSKYDEFTFSGAEETPSSSGYFGGAVNKGGASISTDKYHTGKNSLLLGTGVKGFEATVKTAYSRHKQYRASVWIHQDNASSAQLGYEFTPVGSGETPGQNPAYISLNTSEAKRAGEWYLFNLDIAVPDVNPSQEYMLWVGVKNSGSGSIYADDFRVHPHDASMISYVYNEWGELSHILDNNNLFTEFRYDEMGRLKEIHKESFLHGVVKTSETKYHYKNSSNPSH